MKNKLFVYFLACLFTFFLSACARDTKHIHHVEDDAAVKLAETADSINHSLKKLARVQAAATPPAPYKKLPDADTPGLTAYASIDWSGPIAPLVSKIAEASQFELRVLGKEPSIPILVSVTAKNAPLASILRDIDYQAAKKADIRIYGHRKIIELRYGRG